ncbi:Fructose-1,6-bisphosphatase/inositol-1-monophosphatase [Roseobacter fucihabitans]|uniref:Fructose-1, 6-bisphosphatase/inositol-1-monophosphatase n=1 Tax=Roseobacter fucihabitans TaxID=1537242 RepID=A0ABZ2BRW1_9RHOB|nr:inositol monophosphatase [Roseobacter litoralis]MBC6965565.1 Inositol-1-monophosphatase [Roseobacter litoralis]
MTQAVTNDCIQTIERIVLEAGKLALSHFHKLSTVPVEAKGHLDLVTAADKEVEAFVTQALVAAFPEDGVFGEEGAARPGRSGRTWVIDPIDGTFNFVRGGDQWAILIGLYEGGVPTFGVIHVPLRKQTLLGGKGIPSTLNGAAIAQRKGMKPGQASCGVGFHPMVPVDQRLETLRFVLEEAQMSFRCCGSAALSMIEVALGQVDGYLGMGESSWDVMGPVPILEQIGIQTTLDWTQFDLNDKLRFACGTPEFLKAVAPIVPFGTTLDLK